MSGEVAASATLIVRTLGGLRLEVEGERVEHRVPMKAAAMIAYLIDSGGSATRSRLAGLFWSDQAEDRARANLRVALTRLRSELGGHLESDRRSVRLVGRVDHDVELLLTSRAEAIADIAVGEFLGGVEFDDAPLFEEWVTGRRSQIRHAVLERLIGAAIDAESTGDWDASLRCADRAIETDPIDERAHRVGMRAALRRDGRSIALARYRACVEVIDGELGLEPEPETLELAREIEAGSTGGVLDRSLLEPDTAIETTHDRLVVPPTPFFGRVRELEQIEHLVGGGARVVTLVGPGGAGKTRLAERAADRLRTHIDRQVVVELLGVSDADRVPAIVSTACGVPSDSGDPLAGLVEHIAAMRLLLVIDNADEVAQDVGLLCSHLAARCDELVVLITSRVALGMSVEHVVAIDGLNVDGESEVPPPVALFVERARRFDADVQPDGDVRAICELVGGLPLAIELAARWAGAMPVSEIATRMTEGETLLETDAPDVPERQRSMRRVLDLTWDQLDRERREQMSQLSVFRGGFDLAGAVAVAGVSAADLQHLASRSLLRRVPGGRFAMHELVRQHAAMLLTDRFAVAERHARFMLDRVESARATLLSAGSSQAVVQLTADFDNIVTAWEHVVAIGEFDRLVPAASPLSVYSIAATRDVETADLFRRAADRSTGALRGCMLTYQLTVVWRRGTIEGAAELYERARRALDEGTGSDDEARWRAVLANVYATSLAEQGGNPEAALVAIDGPLSEMRELDDQELVAELELTAGRAHGIGGRFAASEALLTSAMERFEQSGNDWGRVDAIGLLAATYAEQYRVWEALQADRRALALGTARRDEQSICTGHANLGASLVLVGAWDEAHEHTATALRHACEQNDLLFEAYVRCQMGEVALGRGDRKAAESHFLVGIAGLRSTRYQIGLRLKLSEWARFLIDERRWIEAELVIDEALDVCASMGGDHFVVTLDAIRARCLLGLGRTDEALRLAQDVWDRIRVSGGRRLPNPIVSMSDCAAVFDGLGDTTSLDAVRELARQRVREVVGGFEEPVYRQSYLALPAVVALTAG